MPWEDGRQAGAAAYRRYPTRRAGHDDRIGSQMAPISPAEVFADARSAMERGDWNAFFPCLDREDLVRIAKNSVKGLINQDAVGLQALSAELSFPAEAIDRLRDVERKMAGTSDEIVKMTLSGTLPADAAEVMVGHRHWFREYEKILANALKSVPDLPAFTAALERRMRAVVGGGSISAEMFVGETLGDLVVEGDKAWATRRISEGWTEDIGFVAKGGAWYIKILARRPRTIPRTIG